MTLHTTEHTLGIADTLLHSVHENGSGIDQYEESVAQVVTLLYTCHCTVHIMPSGHDEHLCWSFRGEVKITLLSRYECNDFVKLICFHARVDERFGRCMTRH